MAIVETVGLLSFSVGMNQNNNKCGPGKVAGSVQYGNRYGTSGGGKMDTSMQEVCHHLLSYLSN